MQVVAIGKGFYKGIFRRVGAIFDLDEKDSKKMPSWVKAAPDVAVAKVEAAKAKKAADDKVKAGIVAASGGKAARAKAAALSKELSGAGVEGENLVG